MQELPESSRGDTFTESYFIVGFANRNKKSYKAEFILPHWGNKSKFSRISALGFDTSTKLDVELSLYTLWKP